VHSRRQELDTLDNGNGDEMEHGTKKRRKNMYVAFPTAIAKTAIAASVSL